MLADRCWPGMNGVWGVEGQILKQGELMIGRRFDTQALAAQWASQERNELERAG